MSHAALIAKKRPFPLSVPWFVFCLLVAAGFLAWLGLAFAASPEASIQGAPASGQISPASVAPPQPLSLLDSLTVAPIPEARYAGSGSGLAMAFPYWGSAANQAGNLLPPDKQKSYLFSFDKGEHDSPYVGLARIDRLDIMDLNRMSPGEYGAEFMIGYKVTSLGSLFFGKGMQLERPGETSVKLQDDGWRFKFVKKFW